MIKRSVFIVWFLALALLGAMAPSANADVNGSGAYQGASLQPMPGQQLDSEQVRQVFKQIKTTGMNQVVLNPIYIQDNIHSTEIWRRADSPTDAQLAKAIKNARDAGLRVVLKPHLELKNNEWRAHIAFDNNADADKWQASWKAQLMKLAGMDGVSELVTGTELRGVLLTSVPDKNLTFNKNNPARWIKMVKALRSAYPKIKYTYAAHTNDESLLLSKDFVKTLDYLSVTYYPRPPAGFKNPIVKDQYNLTASEITANKAAVKLLRADMQNDKTKYFDKLRNKYVDKNGNKIKLVFAETGFRSIKVSSYFKKGDEVGPSDVDLNFQRNQYEAFFQFADSISYVKGYWVYRYYNTTTSGGTGDAWFTPQHKPARLVIAKWFGGRDPE